MKGDIMGNQHTTPWTEADLAYLRSAYANKAPLQDIADHLRRGKGAVRTKAYHLRLRPTFWTPAEEARLRELYAVEIPNLQEIAQKLGRPYAGVACKASDLGLTVPGRHRPQSTEVARAAGIKRMQNPELRRRIAETVKRHWQQHGHPRGMLGKHHRPEYCHAIRRRVKAMWANPNHVVNSEAHRQRISDQAMATRMRLRREGRLRGYSRANGGYREDIDLYVRSRWEANYARYLNWLQTQGNIRAWAYEPETFVFEAIKRGTRTYTPDFKVIENDGRVVYHEVKGWMDQKSQTRLKRMAKYYPDIPVVVIDKPIYQAIGQWRRLIPGWEE